MSKKTTLEIGHSAPDMIRPSSDERDISISDFKGQTVILYFYPKDDTPGCTAEACNFRDNIKTIDKSNAVILGVSPDPVKKHLKFISKYDLPFVLLSDEDHAIAELYGVWVEKSMYGKTYMGVERSTFVIDPDGVITHIFRKVKAKTHINEILEILN